MPNQPTYEELEQQIQQLEEAKLRYQQKEKILLLEKEFTSMSNSTQIVETMLNTTHMMIASMDIQFNFIKVNRAYAEADKKEPSFFPGKNHFDLYPNRENEELFRSVFDKGESISYYAKPFE